MQMWVIMCYLMRIILLQNLLNMWATFIIGCCIVFWILCSVSVLVTVRYVDNKAQNIEN